MKKTYHGSCHCGAVRYEADIDLSKGTFRCNCSMCFKSRAWLAPVAASDFRLISGEQSLVDYQFNKHVIHHRFCKTCGVRPFSQGKDPKGNVSYAVRVNALDDVDAQDLVDAPVRYFDMRHDNMKSPPAETRHL
jgi:hypothetical protein